MHKLCADFKKTQKKPFTKGFHDKVAGVERIELPSKVLETSVLPLNHTPKKNVDSYEIRTREWRRERALC